MEMEDSRYLGRLQAKHSTRILLLSPTPPPPGSDANPRSVPLEGYLCSGTHVDEVYLPGAPLSYDSANSQTAIRQATPLVVAKVKWAEAEGYDAVVINCTLDPGLGQAQSVSGIPVLGIGATSRAIANLFGSKPAMLFPDTIGVLHLADDEEKTFAALARVGRWQINRRGADVLIPDCAYIGGLSHRLQEELGVPVLPNLAVGLKAAEMVAALGVKPEQAWVAEGRAGPLEQALSRLLARLHGWLARWRRPG